jgi:hypothetical protein
MIAAGVALDRDEVGEGAAGVDTYEYVRAIHIGERRASERLPARTWHSGASRHPHQYLRGLTQNERRASDTLTART